MGEGERHLRLDVEIASEPIAGRLTAEQGTCLPFTGWLEFAAALGQVLGPRPADPPLGGPMTAEADEEGVRHDRHH